MNEMEIIFSIPLFCCLITISFQFPLHYSSCPESCKCMHFSENTTVVCYSKGENSQLNLPQKTSHASFIGDGSNFMPKWVHGGEQWRHLHTIEYSDFFMPELKKDVHAIVFDKAFLRSLSVHTCSAQNVRTDTFEGLSNLTYLDISYNPNLRFEVVMRSLKSTCPALKTLIMKGIHQNSEPYRIREDFIAGLKAKPIEVLDISESNVEEFGYDVYLELKNLTFLNISHTKIKRIPNVYPCSAALPSISLQRILDASNNTVIIDSISDDIYRSFSFEISLYKIVYFQNSRFLSSGIQGNYSNCKLTTISPSNIQEIHLSGSNIRYLNTSVPWYLSHQLRVLDLSSTALEYLSPTLYSPNNSIETLLLQDNMLYLMENLSEYQFVFLNQFSNLRVLNLSNNKLTYIPTSYFGMSELTHLSLSNNRLSSISLDDFLKLQYLQFLDLTGITNLSCKDVLTLPNHETMLNTSINKNLKIAMDTHLRQRCKCRECTIQSCPNCSYLFVFLLLLVVLAAFLRLLSWFYTRRKYRPYCNWCICQWMDHVTPHKPEIHFLVFLSYSGDDCQFAVDTAYEELNSRLKERYRTRDDLVCSGDTHFFPGRLIEEEIMRCLEGSVVVVLFISNSFLASQWCVLEAKLADRKLKPVILVIKEECRQKFLPDGLRRFLERYTTVSWTQEGDVHTVRPKWDRIVEAIVELAENHSSFQYLKINRNNDMT